MFNPKTMFKILRVSGVRIKLDAEKKQMIIFTDSDKKSFSFDEIEKMINGDDDRKEH